MTENNQRKNILEAKEARFSLVELFKSDPFEFSRMKKIPLTMIDVTNRGKREDVRRTGMLEKVLDL